MSYGFKKVVIMKITKLENIVEVSAGQGAPQGDDSYCDNGLPFIKAGNLEDLIITNDEYKSCKLVNRETANKYKLKLYPKDTLVFAKSGMSATKGRIYCLNNEAHVVNHLSTIIPNTKFIETKYLKYYFYVFPPSRLIKDESYPSISLGDIKKIEIPLPSIDDQKRIVKILDQADDLRQKRKQAIDLMDEYLKSTFLEMFGDPVKNPKGWEKQKFEKLGTLDRGISKHRPRNAPELLGGNHPLIQTGDVANCGIYIEKFNSTYSDIGLKQSKKWPKGTLCITIAANIARTGILSFDACFPDSVVGFIANESKTNNKFIHYWMSFLQEILERNAPESAQKNINLKILRELDVIAPPIEQQNRFAEIVNKTESLRQKMLAQSEEIEKQFQSLMQKAFKGNL